MKKLLTALTALAMLAGVSAVEARQLGFIADAATVDDVTTTVCTTGDNGTVDMFVNGVDLDQTWRLEQERGSPGSGAWVPVSGFEDIATTVNGGAAVGGQTQIARYVSDKPNCFRLHMTVDNAGTGQVQIVADGAPTPNPGSATHNRVYDDFQHGTLPISTTHNGATPSYVVFIGAGNAAVLGVIEGEGEGTLTMSNGDSGTDDQDLTVLSYGLITNAALISDGLTILEGRIAQSQITDTRVNFGLADRINAATEEEPFQCDTNVCVEGQVASFSNAVTFLFDTDSNDAEGDFWLATNMNANTLGNASDEYSLDGKVPTVATYQVLRLEVDSAGNAFYYIDGVLVGAEQLAVATSAVLIPHFTAGSAEAQTGTVNKLHLDYWDFYVPRPAGVS